MKTPRYIALASMLMWTILTGFWIPGGLLILAAESWRWMDRRWQFQEKDDRKFVNAAVVSMVIGLIYAWLNPQGAFTLLESIQTVISSDVLGNRESFQPYEFVILVSPFLTFPLFWSTRFRTTPPPRFTIFGRYIPQKVKDEARWLNDVIPVEGGYALICLSAACKTQTPNLSFFILMALVIAWFLWENRPAKRSAAPWITHLAVCVFGAFFLFTGLSELQAVFQEKFINYIAQLSRRDPIPREAKTAIGRAGKLNLSARIVLRANAGFNPPFLLAQDYFDEYRRGTWQISNFKSVTNVLDDGDLQTWTLRLPSPSHTNRSVIDFRHSLKLDGGRLPLPMGAYRLSGLPVGEVLTNEYGRVSVVDGPGLIDYSVAFAPGLNTLAPPIRNWKSEMKEIDISGRDRRYIDTLKEQLQLENPGRRIDAHEIARRVSSFFLTNNFVYASRLAETDLPDPESNTTPLEHFLTESRKGHCEYYATATVLLMRSGAVPARYVVGYSVAEKRKDEIIARERDRHAWCQYFSFADGKWHDLDTTPGEWRIMDAEHASAIQPFLDLLNDAQFALSSGFWQWVQKVQELEVLMGVFLVFLFGFLIYRIIKQQNQRRIQRSRDSSALRWRQQGLDSAFYTVMTQLEKMGYHRADGETVRAWISQRVPDNDRLMELADLHYRYRFDPEDFGHELRESFFDKSMREYERLLRQWKDSRESTHGKKNSR